MALFTNRSSTRRNNACSSLIQRRRRKNSRRSQLTYESLEERRLMAADIDFSNGVLTIQGDGQNDWVQVKPIETPVPELARVNGHGSRVEVPTFLTLEVTLGHIAPRSTSPQIYDTVSELAWESGLVETIVFDGAAGHDHFYNETDIPSVLYGGRGVDHLYGGSNKDELYGGTQTDFLYGRGDQDILVGDWGRDQLYGGDGNDTLHGDGHSDILSGGSGHDTLYGGSGNDQLYGEDHNDKLYGGFGNDKLYGGSGYDELYGEEHNDNLDGGLNDDKLYGGSGADYLYGGEDDDVLVGNGGNDDLVGGPGVDLLDEPISLEATLTNGLLVTKYWNGFVFLNGTDTLNSIEEITLTGTSTNDTIDASGYSLGGVTLVGGDGDDVLVGSSKGDTLTGGNGNDTIDGKNGIDHLDESVVSNAKLTDGKLTHTLWGFVQTDTFMSIEDVTLTGSELDNVITATAFTVGGVTIKGEDGNDTITGTSHNDVLHGGNGADKLFGGSGDDSLHGDDDVDILFGGNDSDTLFGGKGDDYLSGDFGNDILYGGLDDDDLYGHSGDDILFGGKGTDYLYGGTHNDQLLGGEGVDYLYGENGNDGLFGGAGIDFLSGDVGMDRYLYQTGDFTAGYLTSSDVKIKFEGIPTSTTINVDGEDCVYTAAAWSDEEVQVVDEALAVLQEKQGNNSLLKKADGSDLTFQRLGTSSCKPTGFNSSGVVKLSDNALNSGDSYTHQAVFHEIGHNWDSENPDWDGFKELSGWSQSARLFANPNFVLSTDGNWYHETTATFAWDYGKTNPVEDFATSFAAYFMDYSGESYLNSGAPNIPDKWDFIDNFLDDLANA